MDELISGKEAKLSWANGEDVLYRSGDKVWRNLNDTDFYSSIFENKSYDFCLKPRTITINGITCHSEDEAVKLIKEFFT